MPDKLPLDPDKLAADVGKELIKPIYEDAIQPAVREVGKSLGGVVRVALSPLNGLVWGYDKMAAYLEIAILEKLKNVDPLKIRTPAIEVAGPALEAMRFVGENSTLKDLFASLLASAMNEDTAHKVHPSFVELLKNMSRDEAVILKFMAAVNTISVMDVLITTVRNGKESSVFPHERGVTNLKSLNGLSPKVNLRSCVDNLIRLRLVEIDMSLKLENTGDYDEIIADANHRLMGKAAEQMNYVMTYNKGIMKLTAFGKMFCECVIGLQPAVVMLGSTRPKG